MSVSVIPLDPIPTSPEVRVGLGFQFPGIGGWWSGVELGRNHRTQAVGVPCRVWSPDTARHVYYMIQEVQS